MVTGDQVREAAEKAGVTYIEHHDCSLCGSMVAYTIENGQLFFNPGCGCSWSPREPRSWDDAAEWINMQQREGKWGDVGAAIAAKFGLELSSAS